ncbi:MAG: hypothetical protein ACI86C_001543 [Candidatus Latescibacterota bacterium]|jgi:hypothetical protein
MSYRVISIAMIIGFLFGCGGESQEETEKERIETVSADECVNAKESPSKSRHMKSIGFGDGSDGEFYLAYDDVFQLEEREYNFTNVNLDLGSLLTVVGELSESEGTIHINSLGVCNLLGDVDISEYGGTFILNCNSSITMEGSYSHPNGNTSLATSEWILTSVETSTNISESTISVGTTDISGAELSTISASVVAGEVTYSPGVLVIHDNSVIIEGGEGSFELEDESGDESLTNCSS